MHQSFNLIFISRGFSAGKSGTEWSPLSLFHTNQSTFKHRTISMQSHQQHYLIKGSWVETTTSGGFSASPTDFLHRVRVSLSATAGRGQGERASCNLRLCSLLLFWSTFSSTLLRRPRTSWCPSRPPLYPLPRVNATLDQSRQSCL